MARTLSRFKTDRSVLFGTQSLERRCLFDAVSWDGGAETLDWTDAANWSNDVVPTAADDVTIDVADSITVSITSGAHSVNRLDCAENLTLDGAALSVATTSSIDGTFRLRGDGILGGTGDVLLNATTIWSVGSMTGTGTTRIGSGGTLTFATELIDTISPRISRNFENNGTVQWSHRINFELNNSQFTNNGVIDITASVLGNVYGTNALINNGSITKNGTATRISWYIPVINNGSMSASSGEFEFFRDLAQDGVLTASGPGVINFYASSSMGPNSTTDGNGQFRFVWGTHILNPQRYVPTGTTAFTDTANVTVNTAIAQFVYPLRGSGAFNVPVSLNDVQISGTFGFNQPVTLTGTPRLGGDVIFNSTVTRSFVNLHITSGTVTFPGNEPLSIDTLTLSGVLNTPAAVMLNTAATIGGGFGGGGEPVTISAPVTVALSGGSVSKDIVNNGTIRCDSSSGSLTSPGNLNVLTNNGQIIRSVAGTNAIIMPLTNNGSILINAGTFSAAALTNNGTVSVAAGALMGLQAATLNAGSSFTGAGNVAFVSGGPAILDAATFTTTGDLRFLGGTVVLNIPRTLAGNRTIAGNVTFNQPVSFGGTITVTGLTTFNSTTTFGAALTVNGQATANITSSATFAGTVTVSGRLNVDTPSPGITIPTLSVVNVLGGSGELTVSNSLNFTGSMVGTGTTRLGPTASVTFGHCFLDRTLVLAPNRPTSVWTSLPGVLANGRVDLTNNTLVINHQNNFTLAGVESLVRSGRAGGIWTGTGITSSAAASQPGTGISVADSTALFTAFPATFAGVPIDSTTVLLHFSVEGDVNLDRSVNFDDLLILAQNYGQTGRTFSQGNIDYSADGLVGFDDLLLLAQRYGTSLAAPALFAPSRHAKKTTGRALLEL